MQEEYEHPFYISKHPIQMIMRDQDLFCVSIVIIATFNQLSQRLIKIEK